VKISGEARELVRRRARGACEYCRLPEDASVLPHQVDHIIATQHGGTDELGNVCLCCVRCNLKKGPNIASIDPRDNRVVPLFHPRSQAWREHFSLDRDARIHGLTPEGRATVELMGMNDAERLELRSLLVQLGRLS
jgi:hypothetical protein